jgi:CheY-like chemotaxis protein/signal transduction histidine kinase
MHLTFRTKLTAVVGAAALAFVILILIGTLSEHRVERQLAAIQERYVPKVELGPQLESQFERLRRSMQDAVATQDMEALAATRQLLSQFLDQLAAARDAVTPSDAAALRSAVQDYYAAAYDISRRLIAGEKGEGLVDAMAAMQERHTQTAARLQKATALDKGELSEAFLLARRAQATSARIRLVVSLVCVGMVILLSVWLGRDVLRSLSALTAGVQRFAKGQFAQPIPVTTRDELGAVAEQTNQMAGSLHRLSAERDRNDWLKSGEAGLAHELRGDLEPREVATRAARFLARYLEAPAAALYCGDQGRTLVLLGQYARPHATGGASATPSFAPGEGLVGQAALGDEIEVVSDPPADYLRVGSGLGDSAPRAIVFLPLARVGNLTGVLELAVFKPWTSLQGELLTAVRETLTIALEVARARAALSELLVETQRQAQRLATQEEELRSTNEELQAQQEELRHTNDQVIERAKELEEQRRVLEEKNAELQDTRRRLEQKAVELTTVSTYKSQFLANMSHELRTPLNSMLLLSSLMAQNEGGNLTDKQVEFSRTINAAGKDLLALINQVLDLAKIESGKQQIRIEPVSLRQMAQHVERVFGPLARDKGLRFVVEVAPDLPETIATDKQRLDQILNNLIGNAIKFTDRGQVGLRVTRPAANQRPRRDDLDPAHTIVFAVSDTGIGIAAEFQQRIFQPFEQVESKSDRRYGGTGLGLPIARELATLLGGELELQTAAGKGSTFTCYLPETHAGRAGAETPAAAAPNPAPAADDRGTLDPGDRCLLLIEDDPTFAEILGGVIHDQGLKYVVAADGHSGLRLAKEQKPHAIILDVRLPDVDGWTVMERLHADPETASIPVHFISASDGGERGMAMGAVGYLTKPASHRDLARVIDSLVPKRERDCRVLVVEDDGDTADSLVRRLAGERLVARRVASAREALAALESERFDCMILDLSLPDMDGLELLAALQERGAPESPPVVVYTGRALSKAEAKRLEAYAEAIVLKEGASTERLVDEVRLFARRFRDGIPSRRQIVSRAHPGDLNLNGRKILVVDDDMRTVYALSALLRAKGAEVVTADTGHAALDMLNNHADVQIVLMDMMMPEMDGYEALRRLRKEERFRDLPVIALTAKAMKGDREQCLQAGANEYLSKPIDPDQLLAVLRTQLQAPPATG